MFKIFIFFGGVNCNIDVAKYKYINIFIFFGCGGGEVKEV